MSNPFRWVNPGRGSNPQNVVFRGGNVGKTRVYAPRPGELLMSKTGVAIVTPGGYRHTISHTSPRTDLLGKQVADHRWIGTIETARTVYRRYDEDGDRLSAWPVLDKPVILWVRKPWDGLYPLTAGEYYSSGAWHASWDLAMPIGTPLVSPMRGTVVEMNDGVPNNKPGHNPGSGAPSNFVVIYGYDKYNRKRTAFLQHMSKGVRVKWGQKVKAGTPLGKSGNTGNSTGPHLHINVQYGWVPRYSHYRNHSLAVYPPSQLWS